MNQLNKPNWEPWHQERESFKARETEGLKKDMAALENHIEKLLEVVPKDAAGWPNLTGLDLINLLRKDLLLAKALLNQIP